MNNTPCQPATVGPARKLTVVTTCRLRDLPVLRITVRKLAENMALKSLQVVAPAHECGVIAAALGEQAMVISEDELIPGMTISELRKIVRPHFPRAAGWYFQQFLKLQFAFVDVADDYYLIWDADTVPLRPLNFFDAEDRMLLTKADEYHAPYFETYQRLFREPANREFSFIAQHIVVQKSFAREMLERVRQHGRSGRDWAWSIMENLPEKGDNLFSEYETYGHYMKNHHPDRVRFVNRPWLREGTRCTHGWIPSQRDLHKLAGQYDYAAFERAGDSWLQWGRMTLKRWLKRR